MKDLKRLTEKIPFPSGEVIARGTVEGLPVEITRYTALEIANRDCIWQYRVKEALSISQRERIQATNLQLDLQRVLDGERTLCDFPIVAEIRARLEKSKAEEGN